MSNNHILVINAGSSSLKFSLFATEGEDVSSTAELAGLVERIGSTDAVMKWLQDNEKRQTLLPNADHREALRAVMTMISDTAQFDKIDAVGHRVVHGGEFFSDSVVIEGGVLDKISACNHLAPLHNPANLSCVEILQQDYPDIPQVAVFDTAFHQTLPQEAYTYALPYALYKEHGVRRYGFHGTSHKYVSQKAVEQLSLNSDDHRIITMHLGNGCSTCAVRNGESIDTSMGMTPLAGVVMGTRCGDIDPSLHQYLADSLGYSLDQVTDLLNKKSGLLGVSGISNDMRELCDAAEKGSAQAQLAIDVFCYCLAKNVCSLAMPLGRVDALVFTGGIGEHAIVIRAKVIEKLSLLSCVLDEARNKVHGSGNAGVITQENSTPAVVVKTEEEWMIARDTFRLAKLNG